MGGKRVKFPTLRDVPRKPRMGRLGPSGAIEAIDELLAPERYEEVDWGGAREARRGGRFRAGYDNLMTFAQRKRAAYREHMGEAGVKVLDALERVAAELEAESAAMPLTWQNAVIQLVEALSGADQTAGVHQSVKWAMEALAQAVEAEVRAAVFETLPTHALAIRVFASVQGEGHSVDDLLLPGGGIEREGFARLVEHVSRGVAAWRVERSSGGAKLAPSDAVARGIGGTDGAEAGRQAAGEAASAEAGPPRSSAVASAPSRPGGGHAFDPGAERHGGGAVGAGGVAAAGAGMGSMSAAQVPAQGVAQGPVEGPAKGAAAMRGPGGALPVDGAQPVALEDDADYFERADRIRQRLREKAQSGG